MATTYTRNQASAPPDHRTSIATSVASSSGNTRFSLASDETGESSQRRSIIRGNGDALDTDEEEEEEEEDDERRDAQTNDSTYLKYSKGDTPRRRSHKSSSHGSFLLSKPVSETSPRTTDNDRRLRRREAAGDFKGKHVIRGAEPDRTKMSSSPGLDTGASPLSKKRDTARVGKYRGPDATVNTANMRRAEGRYDGTTGPQAVHDSMDFDSRQIVSLALGLSESRRNAQRRNISSPLPPTVSGFADQNAGGSLRQYMQQQRRASRNLSPKPDRGERTLPASPRGRQSVGSPSQPSFAAQEEEGYQYNFSASTLARAEKAKNAIELMAQYRRLLQYVPPLKPVTISRATTLSPPGSSHESLGHNTARPSSAQQSLGRPYNPLQYIRNRTVRARERKTIDGEAEGYGDLDCVKLWIDEIAKVAAGSDFLATDTVPLPPLKTVDGTERPLAQSMSIGRGSAMKSPKPRVGWLTIPADMVAEVFWLEQGDNKKTIEDHHWQKIFSPRLNLIHPVTDSDQAAFNDFPMRHGRNSTTSDAGTELKLPTFRPIHQHEPDSSLDSAGSTARHKLDGIAQSPDLPDPSYNNHPKLASIAKRRWDSSDSESGPNSRRARSGTAESKSNTDVLEKQMMEMMAKEALLPGKSGSLDLNSHKIVESIEATKPGIRDELAKRKGSLPRLLMNPSSPTVQPRESTGSLLRSDESRQTSGRSSLEVPDANGRRSLEYIDNTSRDFMSRYQPLGSLTQVNGANLTPSQSRQASPTRTPLDRVRSKLPFRREPSPDRALRQESFRTQLSRTYSEPSSPTSPSAVGRRSKSPTRGIISRGTEEGFRLARSTTSQRKDNDQSGIRGLFKSGRSNVSRIGDMIWKKDSANTSAETSDDDQLAEGQFPRSSMKERRSFELPSFTSPFDRRGRDKRIRSTEIPSSHPQEDQPSRVGRLQPPRIDISVASPTSPNGHDDTPRDRTRDSLTGQSETSRLNDILGLPGKIACSSDRGVPITGLGLVTRDRRPSTLSRHWSISDRDPSADPAPRPLNRREFARVAALLVSSGVKASEISRRAHEIRDITRPVVDPAAENFSKNASYIAIVKLNRDDNLIIEPTPRYKENVVAAKILSNDIQISSQQWQHAASEFSTVAISNLLSTIHNLQTKIIGHTSPSVLSAPRSDCESSPARAKSAQPIGLSEINKRAADEADEVSRDLVEIHTLKVKVLKEKMERLLRRRRQRFRWVRKGGWVVLEWLLVGVMWWVWGIVVLWRALGAVSGGIGGFARWLLWL